MNIEFIVESIKKPVEELTDYDFFRIMIEARNKKRYDISDAIRDFFVEEDFRISFDKDSVTIIPPWSYIRTHRLDGSYWRIKYNAL